MYKGAPELKLDKLSEGTIAAAIVGTGAVIAVLAALFWLPFVRAKVIKRDYTIRWYHFFYGPLLWSRPAPEVALDAAISSVPDYRTYGRDQPVDAPAGNDMHDVENRINPTLMTTGSHEDTAANSPDGSEKNYPVDGHKPTHTPTTSHTPHHAPLTEVEAPAEPHPIEGSWILPKNLWIILRYRVPKALLHGSSVDVHKLQAGATGEQQRISEMHERAKQYDNEVSGYLGCFGRS